MTANGSCDGGGGGDGDDDSGGGHTSLMILILLLLFHSSQIVSPCLVQPLGMDFDRETMPGWMKLPDPISLPDRPFEVDYVRSYRKL